MAEETVAKDILDKLNAGIEISNVDFDIRDLNVAQDEVKAVIRADTAGNQTNDLKITLDGEDVNVTATDLDIRDLTSVSDSVEVLQDTAANLKTEIANPAGIILGTATYGSDDGGLSWHPLRIAADGVLDVSVVQGGWLGCMFIRGLGFTFSHTGPASQTGHVQSFTDDDLVTYLKITNSGSESGTMITKFIVPTSTLFSSLNCSFTQGTTAGDAINHQTKLEYSINDIDWDEIFDETSAGDYTKTAANITAKYFKVTMYLDGAGTGAGNITMKIFNLFE